MNPKELQCKQEVYGGGGCPSPRKCEICGDGPCVKSQVVDTTPNVTKVGANP
jgi:hypothetical protein